MSLTSAGEKEIQKNEESDRNSESGRLTNEMLLYFSIYFAFLVLKSRKQESKYGFINYKSRQRVKNVCFHGLSMGQSQKTAIFATQLLPDIEQINASAMVAGCHYNIIAPTLR